MRVEEKQTTDVTVFYGTDRQLVNVGNAKKYSRTQTTRLFLGSARVSLPPRHREGDLERPQWWKGEFKEDAEKHVVLTGFTPLAQADWDRLVRAEVNQSAAKQAFVFIHGFNVSFEDAALRTAQMHFDLKFDGAPLFYSWASEAELSPLAYNKDNTKSDRTVPRLVQFLQLVKQRTGAQKIHLIAHSMGNKALINALTRMSTADRALFSEIILCAPDIDRDVFLDLAANFGTAGRHVTLYASANDKALKASRSWAGFPRAGDSGDGVLVVDRIETVDASPVTTDLFGLGHSFYADEPSVLTDIGVLLRQGLPAGQRTGLTPARTPGGKAYWVIK